MSGLGLPRARAHDRVVTAADPVGVVDAASVADRLAVSDVLDAYAQAVDTRDHDLLARLFTDDATLDYTESGGPGDTSRDRTLAWLRDSLALVGPGQHVITNRRIVVEGDTARCNSYLFNPMALPDGDGGTALLLLGGSYDDVLRRTPAGWRISDRTHHVAWTLVRPDGAILAADPNAADPNAPEPSD